MKAWLSALPVVGLVAGATLGFIAFDQLHWQIPAEYAPYLSVAALAGLDTVFGGIRAGIEGRFQNDIFVTGFLLNTLLAAVLAWIGDHIGINLALVAVLVLGARVFNNLSLMRRFYLNKIALARKRLQEETAPQAVLTPPAALSHKSELGGGI
jgi:small basic protein